MSDELLQALKELFECDFRSIPVKTWTRARAAYERAQPWECVCGLCPWCSERRSDWANRGTRAYLCECYNEGLRAQGNAFRRNPAIREILDGLGPPPVEVGMGGTDEAWEQERREKWEETH